MNARWMLSERALHMKCRLWGWADVPMGRVGLLGGAARRRRFLVAPPLLRTRTYLSAASATPSSRHAPRRRGRRARGAALRAHVRLPAAARDGAAGGRQRRALSRAPRLLRRPQLCGGAWPVQQPLASERLSHATASSTRARWAATRAASRRSSSPSPRTRSCRRRIGSRPSRCRSRAPLPTCTLRWSRWWRSPRAARTYPWQTRRAACSATAWASTSRAETCRREGVR